MFRYLTVLAVSGIALYAPSSLAAIPGAARAASEYQVTVKRVDLCTDSACSTFVTIGSGNKVFDIASVAAGAAVGSYADVGGLAAGITYTHVRAYVDETITMTGGGVSDDADVTCYTDATPTQDGDANTAEISDNTTASGVSEDYIVPSDAGSFTGLVDSDWEDLNITVRNTDANTVGDVVITYPLTASYTTIGQEPLIEIQFDTSTAVGVLDTDPTAGDGNCSIFPRPPTVTITIRDP